MSESWKDLPEEEREDFIEYLGNSIQEVMTQAEVDGCLFELITEWPKRKIVAYQIAAIVNKNLKDD